MAKALKTKGTGAQGRENTSEARFNEKEWMLSGLELLQDDVGRR